MVLVGRCMRVGNVMPPDWRMKADVGMRCVYLVPVMIQSSIP